MCYLVEKGRIDEYEAHIIFGQLCLAVGCVHDRGATFHRDLKLENVLLDERYRVKLSDFGFTREFEESTLLDTFCGTIGYASLEMLLGQKYLCQGKQIRTHVESITDLDFRGIHLVSWYHTLCNFDGCPPIWR